MKRLNTTQIMALGFAAVILTGAVLLSLPISSSSGESVGFYDALFTSTSAVCVTGLVVLDVGNVLSIFGQIVLILLIQTGGLGFMTIATLLFMVAGKRITLRDRLVIQEAMNESGLSGMVRLIRWVIWMTLAFEAVGAALLATSFVPDFGWARGLYYAVFHSISAFCNAGFDLLGNYTSLTPYQLDPVVNLTISFLIIAGGLGFGVWRDLFKNRGHFRALKLHTRLVLVTTGGLLLGGTLLIAALEWTNPGTIAGMNFIQKIQAAFFQSVTMRTAGFNTVDLAAMHPETKFVSSILMFIGAAPASTGGGIKVTTFVLMGLFVSTVAHGRENCVIYKRTVSHATVMRAMVVALISACVVGVDLLLLTIAEQDTAFVDLMFETLSAFGTVGVSSAGTPNLGYFARAILIFTMFIGRVGPLTLTLAVASGQAKKSDVKIKYPEERVLVG